MNRILSYVVVALIALAVGAFASSKYFDNREPEVVIEYDTIVETVVDSVGFTVYDTIASPPEKVTIYIPVETPTGEVIDSTEVETQKYTGVEELENGTIRWTAYADKLFATEFELETEKETIVKTVTVTLPPKSALFAGGGLNYNQGISSAEVGLMYNRRQKWQAGIVVNHDLTGLLPKGAQTSIGVRAYIKL